MAKQPANGLTIPHAASVAKPPKGNKPDPCRHRRKKKKQVFVVYKAQKTGSSPPKYYVGRTRGPSLDTAIANREAGHHRTDIGKLVPVCVQDTYAACRGAEQLHADDNVTKGKGIQGHWMPGKGKPIAPIAENNPKKADYLACAQASAKPSPPGCKICAAG